MLVCSKFRNSFVYRVNFSGVILEFYAVARKLDGA
jgi:hypothetical protein